MVTKRLSRLFWMPLSQAQSEAITAFAGEPIDNVEDALLGAFQGEIIRTRGLIRREWGERDFEKILADYWLTVPDGRFVRWSDDRCLFFCEYTYADHDADVYKFGTTPKTCEGWRIEVNQRDFDAWIGEFGARASNSAPHSTASSPVGTHRKGRTPIYDWAAFDAKLYELLDNHGLPSLDDKEWKDQATVERAMAEWCNNEWGDEPAESTLRNRVRSGLARFSQQGRQ